MSQHATEIRDEAYARFLLKQTNGDFIVNDFELGVTWFPHDTLERLSSEAPHGKLLLMAGSLGDVNNKSRTNLTLREYAVKVGYQRVIPDIDDVADLDKVMQLVEEIDEVFRKDVDLEGFSWVRTEFLKDENELPYGFVRMRNSLVFETYFTAYYNYTLVGKE